MIRDPQKLDRPFPRRCGSCGKRAVFPATITHTAEIKHEGKLHSVEVSDLPVQKCRDCEKVFFSNDSDEKISDALREQLGLLKPSEIRESRAKLDLTQRELAAHLGTAEETISRWETGLLIQSRAMDNLLRLYFALPEVRQMLGGQSPGLERNDGIVLVTEGVISTHKGGVFVGKIASPHIVQFSIRCTSHAASGWSHFQRPEVRDMLEGILSLTCDADLTVISGMQSMFQCWNKIWRRVNDDRKQMNLATTGSHRKSDIRRLRRLQMFTENLSNMPEKTRDVLVRSMLPLTSLPWHQGQLADDTSNASPQHP